MEIIFDASQLWSTFIFGTSTLAPQRKGREFRRRIQSKSSDFTDSKWTFNSVAPSPPPSLLIPSVFPASVFGGGPSSDIIFHNKVLKNLYIKGKNCCIVDKFLKASTVRNFSIPPQRYSTKKIKHIWIFHSQLKRGSPRLAETNVTSNEALPKMGA